jgi:hypothetical protein
MGDEIHEIYSTCGSSDKYILVGNGEGREERDLRSGWITDIKMDHNDIRV